MGRKTGKIKFNVNRTGRSHTGSHRNYDLRALANLVNGPAVQERVKNRDLAGYYGHLIRMKHGIQPPEWVVVEGKQVNIEPALVTTSISADNDGNIEHEAEFLDTDPGVVAERVFSSKMGGFSSAIFAIPRGPIDVPTIFAGFDYVLSPNITQNRGYIFDSTDSASQGMFLDAAVEEQKMSTHAMRILYDSLERDHTLALETVLKVREENEELMSIIVARTGVSPGGIAVFDSSIGEEHSRPLIVGSRATTDFQRRASMFRTSTLVDFQLEEKDEEPEDAALTAAKKRYGVAS